jgi:pimeloyl-ACP methyl ester carboxylesterase
VAEELVSIWADNGGVAHPAGYRAMAHSMAEADLRDVLPRIRVPTLLLHGELDERAPATVAAELRASIPSSRLVVIRRAGHMCNAEAPDAFNSQVRHFIRSIDPR